MSSGSPTNGVYFKSVDAQSGLLAVEGASQSASLDSPVGSGGGSLKRNSSYGTDGSPRTVFVDPSGDDAIIYDGDNQLLGQQAVPAEYQSSSKRTALVAAMFFIGGAVACWVAMSEMLKDLMIDYNKPFWVSYLVHGSYITVFPLVIPFERWRLRRLERRRLARVRRSDGPRSWDMRRLSDSVNDDKTLWGSLGDKMVANWRPAFLMGVIYSVGCWIWYLSLKTTLPSANNAIYMSSSVFVFLLSIPILGETCAINKAVAVMFTISGVCVVAFASSSNGGDEGKSGGGKGGVGYILCLVATITYALYEVFAGIYGSKSRRKLERLSDSFVLLGLMGVGSIFLLWPIEIVLHLTGFETYEAPDAKTTNLILLNFFLDVLCNICILFGIALTSPLTVSVGLATVIPATIVTDYFARGTPIHTLPVVGCLLILCGFGLLHIPFTRSETVRRKVGHDTSQAGGVLGIKSRTRRQSFAAPAAGAAITVNFMESPISKPLTD